jgi:hypothetical protein
MCAVTAAALAVDGSPDNILDNQREYSLENINNFAGATSR